MRVFILTAVFASILLLPWYVPTVLAIILIAWWEAYVSVIIGGVMLDALFGAPIVVLGGFSFIYTGLFVISSATAFFLRRAILE